MTTPQTGSTELHPSWCVRDRCSVELERVSAASHATAMIEQGQAATQIVQWVEWFADVDGPILEQRPGVLAVMQGEQIDDGRPLSASECRDLAAVLLLAADKLESLDRA